MIKQVKKIVIVGNVGGGKTILSRQLALLYQLPLTHVDSIQYTADLQMRPYRDSIEVLNQIQKQDSWIIDGYGPLDIIEQRFQLADRIVFVDLPLWRHYWWCFKRQVLSLWAPRKELPAGCDEATWRHTVKLFKTIRKMHKLMRPELLRIFARENLKGKMCYVTSLSEWRNLYRDGFK